MNTPAVQHVSPRRTRKRQSGVSMLELLVSLLIFSFGMLGLAGLQIRSLTLSQSSLYRSQATALADDILDRMRVDRANAVASPSLWNTSLTATASGVTGSLLYQTELKDWKTSVEALLPSGKASVDVTAGIATITLQWDDSRGRDPSPQSWVTVSRL